MKTRQDPLSRVNKFLQGLVEGPFARFFPTTLQPVQIERKLLRSMEDAAMYQREGSWLAPEIYDVYMSFADHKRLQPLLGPPGQPGQLEKGWKEQLIKFAKQHSYKLMYDPVLRLHPSSAVQVGKLNIVPAFVNKLQAGAENEDGSMFTTTLSADQLRSMGVTVPGSLPGQAPLPSSQVPTSRAGSNPAMNLSGVQQPMSQSQPYAPQMPRGPQMPQAWLTINIPQQGQRVYRIDKPVNSIGRQLVNNDIIVEDKRVSRYHAQIKFEEDGQFHIYDLRSTNGLTINGTPNLRQHILQTGDHFTIGSYDFYFEKR